MRRMCETCLPTWAADIRLLTERVDAAIAREQALAEALRAVAIKPSTYCWCGSRDGGHSDDCIQANAALHQHEEATR